MIYKISATNPDPEETIEYYYYVRYDNIMFLPDGTCSVDIDDCTTPMGGWFSPESFQVGNYTYSGYESLESLFNKCVTENIDSFNSVYSYDINTNKSTNLTNLDISLNETIDGSKLCFK